ncbi:hypothetical protein H6G90_34425 [Nostoc sp. FACHB-145]|nr:hypothetical protein [Nostoc sp. FACHB-145]
MFPALAQRKEPVDCNFNVEEASNINRTVRLDKFGITIDIPLNFRAMSRVDGSVEFLDNGTYQLFNCLAKNPGAAGARGYAAIKVAKSKTNYLYSNVYEKVPGKDNMFIVWQKDRQEEVTFHSLSVRIKSSRGIVEIEIIEDSPLENEEDAKEIFKSLLKIAEGTKVI